MTYLRITLLALTMTAALAAPAAAFDLTGTWTGTRKCQDLFSGNAVDLYGYASMAVAAVQTQAREIDELKASVASLQKQVVTRR